MLGARQVGKSTLARKVVAAARGPTHYFDLEKEADVQALAEPWRALEPLEGLVVLDEVQRRPDLFPTLRVLADRSRGARFLVLGSAAPELLKQTSETLAGRVAFFHLPPLGLAEVGMARADRLWLRGGFPRAYTLGSDLESAEWRRAFVRTFIERDVPLLAPGIATGAVRRLWSMLAHVHAQTLNSSELGRSLGVADTTVRGYLDLLVSTFVVRELRPWHENIAKRQVKAPKVYIADSGLLHTLLDIDSRSALDRHPRVGASWEGFCLEAVIQHLGARADQCFFWATHAGAELDLMVVSGGQRRGFEIKLADAPSLTPSMRSSLETLGLSSIDVIYPGERTYSLHDRVRAVPLERLFEEVEALVR